MKLDKQINGTQRKDGTQNGTYRIALDLISKSKNSTTEIIIVVQRV